MTTGTARGKGSSRRSGSTARAKTAEEHFKYWTGFLDKAPFLDGIIVNEFIVNNPSTRPGAADQPGAAGAGGAGAATAPRLSRRPSRSCVPTTGTRTRCFYAYVGGSGKKLNQEMIGPTFIRTLIDCNYRIALERYIYEMSSEKRSQGGIATVRRRHRRLGSQGTRRQEAHGHRVRPVLHASRRHQQAAERRLPRLDGPADERRGQSSGAGGHGGPGMVDIPSSGRGNGAVRREAVPALCHRGQDGDADAGPTLSHATSRMRISRRGWKAGPCSPRKRGPSRPRVFHDMAGSRGDTWAWAGRPIRNTSATPFSG